MLVFGSCRDAKDPSVSAVVAYSINQKIIGSVAVKEWPSDDISIARLFVAPDWREQGMARLIMQHIFKLYPEADAWLYARPYGESIGADYLRRFYMSMGFTISSDNNGRPVMIRKNL